MPSASATDSRQDPTSCDPFAAQQGLPICRQEALPRLVPSKSIDTEVFGWKTVSNPISRGSGGCSLSWSPLPCVAIAMAAWWEPVTANSSIPTQWFAPYGNELSGLHSWDDSFQLCYALSLQPIPSGQAGSSARYYFPQVQHASCSVLTPLQLILVAVNGAGRSVGQCLPSMTRKDQHSTGISNCSFVPSIPSSCSETWRSHAEVLPDQQSNHISRRAVAPLPMEESDFPGPAGCP